MRKALFETCFVVLVLLLACCTKPIKLAQTEDAVRLLGTWELRESQTGKAPNIQYSVGNGNQLRFSKTTYEQYTDGNLGKTGTYRVVQDTATMSEIGLVFPAGQFTNCIIFDNPATAKIFFDFESGRLITLSGFFPSDGGSRRVYEKQ